MLVIGGSLEKGGYPEEILCLTIDSFGSLNSCSSLLWSVLDSVSPVPTGDPPSQWHSQHCKHERNRYKDLARCHNNFVWYRLSVLHFLGYVVGQGWLKLFRTFKEKKCRDFLLLFAHAKLVGLEKITLGTSCVWSPLPQTIPGRYVANDLGQ